MTLVLAEQASKEGFERSRISSLLLRYPDLDGSDLEELVEFYRNASPLETALLTCEDELRPRIAAFERDHGREFSRWRDAIPVLLIYGAISAALFGIVIWH